MSCWNDPAGCTGCNHCQSTRTLTPLEARWLDLDQTMPIHGYVRVDGEWVEPVKEAS